MPLLSKFDSIRKLQRLPFIAEPVRRDPLLEKQRFCPTSNNPRSGFGIPVNQFDEAVPGI